MSEWGRKWRFTFGIALVVPSCAVTLAGSLLPVVNEYTYLGVVLTPSLTWLPHVRHLISRGNRLFAQCVAWCCSDRLSVHFAASLFRSYVLPSISWGLEFCLNSSPAVRLTDGALRRWGRHLLGWPSGSPNAAVSLNLVGQTPNTSAQNVCCLSLVALSPCPVVNAALCLRSSSTLPSPSPVHGRPFASPSAAHWVFHTPVRAALALFLLPIVSRPSFRLTPLLL